MLPEEMDLVRRAQGGDLKAFESLVQMHEMKIYNLALRMTGNPEDAQDLAQEAFLTAFRRLGEFRMESRFSTWMYRLASNLCIDFLRREKRRKTISYPLEDWEGQAPDIPDHRHDPHAELERAEQRRMLEAGLCKLSPEHRQILILREISGLTYDEIGAILGLESGTVKSRIARARLRLRQILIESGNFSNAVSSNQAREEGTA